MRCSRKKVHDTLLRGAVLRPSTRHGGGKDRDSFALLDRIEIRGRGAVMDIARAVDRPREEENSLGERGLTGIDVSCDSDISEISRQGLDWLGLEHRRFHGIHTVVGEFSGVTPSAQEMKKP